MDQRYPTKEQAIQTPLVVGAARMYKYETSHSHSQPHRSVALPTQSPRTKALDRRFPRFDITPQSWATAAVSKISS
jgi:hypothetical protein